MNVRSFGTQIIIGEKYNNHNLILLGCLHNKYHVYKYHIDTEEYQRELASDGTQSTHKFSSNSFNVFRINIESVGVLLHFLCVYFV